MKNITLLFFAMLMSALSWQGMAQAGSTCGDPLVVSSLPFTDSGNTSTYGNDYGSSDIATYAPGAIGNNPNSGYLNGDDVVYTYTPASSQMINLTVSGQSAWTGVFVFTGCSPFESTVGAYGSSSTADLNLEELSVQANETYYIVISTWPTPNSTNYTLNIIDVTPTCAAPQNLEVTELGTTNAVLEWDEPITGEPDNYLSRLVANDNTEPTSFGSMSGDNLAFSYGGGLTPNTDYYFWIKSDCGSEESDLVMLYFRTLCAPTADMFEDFESYTTGSIVPTCWDRIVPTTSAGSQTISSTSPASGVRNIYQYAGSTSNAVIVVLPEFDNIDLGTHWLRLKARVSSGAPGTLSVGYVTDATDYSSFMLIEDLSITNTSYTSDDSEYTVEVPSSVPPNARLAVKNASDSKSYYWDDVYWEAIPSCLPPTALASTAVTQTSVDIEWIANDSETSWNISWGTPGYTPGDVDQAGIGTASIEEYQITSLTAETAYDVYVQAHCAVGDDSVWVGPLSIYTGYCQPTTTGNSSHIDSFTAEGDLGQDISNLSSGDGLDGNGYSDFSAQTVEVTAGEEIDYTVTIESGETAGLKIWVDWNNDMIFDEVDELVYQSSNYAGSFSGTIPILEGTSGTFRMRIGSSYTPSGGPANACAHTGQGEYEDYTINVIPTGPPAINLNSAADFGILAATGISSAGASVISNTNIGVSPGVRASITGFPPSVVINGSIYASDDSAEVADMLAQAHLDLEAAYLFAKGASAPAPTPVAGEQGGLTLYPGIYKSTSTLLIQSGDLTLDAQGDPNARWIFQIDSALTTIGGAGGGNVILTGGAQAKNITWQVGSSVTIGNDTSFKGNILAYTSITFNTGSTSDGRLYAMNGSVALSGDIIIDQPCPAPTDLAVSNITGDSADIDWTEGSIEDEWEVSYGPTGFDPYGAAGTTVSVLLDPETTLIGLDAITAYDVYVRAICDVVNEIEWSGPVSFTTPCGSMAMPWNEDFESGTANNNIVPDLACWSQEIVSGTTNWKFVTANGDSSVLPHSGSLMAEFRNTSRGTAAKLVTPPMDLTSLNTAQLTFYYANANWTGDIDGLRVYYKKSASDPDWTLINGAEYTTEHATWEEVEIILPEAIGATNYVIAFEATSDYARGLNLDDVSIDEAQLSGFVYANGAWSPNHPSGVSTDADDITVVDGIATGVDSFNGTTDMNNLTIVQGATLEVNSILNLHGDLTINGDLVFVSTENGNGELGFVSATSNITGEATVQSYMSTNRSYRMVSSAVTTSNSVHDNWQEGASSNIDNPNPGFGTHITGNTVDQQDGFDATATGNPSMFIVDYSVTPNAFTAVPNTDVNTLDAGVPYLLFVRGDRSMDLTENGSAGETVLRATGTLEYGAQDPQTFPTVNAGEFAMFGNPYQSAVDVVSLFTNGGSNVNNAHYYVYDPTLADHGGYVTVILPGGGNTDGSDANQYLQPGQGAQFTASGNAPSLEFTEANKAPGNFTITSATGNQLSSDNMLTVQLFTTENFSNGGPTHDSFGIIFGEGLDNGITNADARKPMNFYENFGRDHNGTYLSLERREMPVPAEVYPLYSAGYAHPDYTLKMSVDGLEDTFLYLDDHYTGTSTLLEDGETVYSFGIDANDELSLATDRFSVRVEQRLGVDNNGLLAGVRLFPNPLNDNTFYINAPKLNGEQISVSISDLSGRQIFENMLDCRANTVTVSVNDNLASGVYLVTLRHGGEENTYRLVKK